MKKSTVIFLAILVSTIGLLCEQKPAQTFDEALVLSKNAGKPALLDFFAEWCGPCIRFKQESHEVTEIKDALNKIVLYKIDCEKGEGIKLAEKYNITGYPTFILVNSDGETITRWVGYERDFFLKSIDEALVDLTPIEKRASRFADNPDLQDAIALGRYNSSIAEYKKAVDYFIMAQQLDEDNADDYAYDIFKNTSRGFNREYFTYEEVTKAAGAVFNIDDQKNIISAARIMSSISRQNDKTEDAAKYLQKGLAASASSDDPEIKTIHNLMQVDYNLFVTGDSAKAVQFKKASMNDGWTEDANDLNSFAWWCYENLVNLDEAEKLARKAVNLSEPGKAKAMILDTVAHILKARGNIEEAIKFMEMAVAENPDDEQTSKTLEKFKSELEK